MSQDKSLLYGYSLVEVIAGDRGLYGSSVGRVGPTVVQTQRVLGRRRIKY
jgi:hypothetical protein